MRKTTVELQSLVQASSDHMHAALDDATVLLQLTSGQYFSLGGVGNAIWEMVQQPLRVSALIDQLIQRYDVDAQRCQAETLDMLERLKDAGLLTVHGD